MNKEWEEIGWLIVIGLIIWAIFHFFGNSEDGSSYKSNPEIYSKETSQCIEPENPYNEWSGHYAGYRWYEETGNYCSGNSSSFIEGCEVAEEQYSAFTECENAQ